MRCTGGRPRHAVAHLRDLSAFEMFSGGIFNIIRRAAVDFCRLRMLHPQLMPAPKPPSRPLMLDAPQGVCELSRDLRRLFGLSHAAKGTSFSLA